LNRTDTQTIMLSHNPEHVCLFVWLVRSFEIKRLRVS